MSQTQPAPQITGTMFLFQQPELLSVEAHGGLSIAPPEKPFGFAAAIKAAPLTISEIPAAIKDFPVVFLSKDDPVPVAVLGLIDDVNLFIDDAGRWEDHVYIPGYIRRYPFGVAAETGGDRMMVVVDRSYGGFTSGEGEKLFDGAVPTTFTNNAIDFTKRYEEDRVLTKRAMEALKSLDIIEGQTAHYTPRGQGEAVPFAQYFGVDEEKLKALPDERFLELRRNGLLPIVYAQLMSMGNWRRLMVRRAARFGLTEENAAKPIPRA